MQYYCKVDHRAFMIELHDAFYANGKNILFPNEEIVDVAKVLKETKEISRVAIEKYCKEKQISQDEINKLLKANNHTVRDGLSYKLSRQQRKKLERQYAGRPYGDVQLRARLSYISQD